MTTQFEPDLAPLTSQWSPAFGAGKRGLPQRSPSAEIIVAMEPSFWSWEKAASRCHRPTLRSVAMEPSFWSWEKVGQWGYPRLCGNVAMEPSFWSWEKDGQLEIE